MIWGLAFDYCVLWSCQDAREAGFDVSVVTDLTRAVDAAQFDRVSHQMCQCGIGLVRADELCVGRAG